MTRITNNLFESIQKVIQGPTQPVVKEENKEVAEGQVDKAHYCATHVEHPLYGEGECIAEAHADPDADGNIEWYTVQFSDGVRKVYTEAMKVKKAKMHEHAEVTDEMIDQEVADLSDEELEETLQEALALDEASYSAKAARAGKDIGKPGKMFGKIAASAAKRYGSAERGKKVAGAVLAKLRAKSMKEEAMSEGGMPSSVIKSKQLYSRMTPAEFAKAHGDKSDDILRGMAWRHGYGKNSNHYVNKRNEGMKKEEAEQTNEGAMSDLDADRKDRAYQTRQAKTTMKHISNPTPGEKKAAKDIKPGIAGYRDRIAMLKSAQARGGLKAEGMDPVGKEDDDINNDGKTDKSDSYLHNRRKAIKASMKEQIEIKYYVEETATIEVPTEPTYADYLDAVKIIIGSDDAELQQDIINIAEEAYKNNEYEIIVEAAVTKQQKKDVKQKMNYYFGDWKPTNKPETAKHSVGSRHDIVTKGGVTKATARLAHTTGESPEEAKARRAADKRDKQLAKVAKILKSKR